MSAPNLKEIEWAISELENEESGKNGYILLSALYICRDHMLGLTAPPQPVAYSGSSAKVSDETLSLYGDSEFLHTIAGLPASEAWLVMDELMEVLQAVNPKAYDGVMRKLNKL